MRPDTWLGLGLGSGSGLPDTDIDPEGGVLHGAGPKGQGCRRVRVKAAQARCCGPTPCRPRADHSGRPACLVRGRARARVRVRVRARVRVSVRVRARARARVRARVRAAGLHSCASSARLVCRKLAWVS